MKPLTRNELAQMIRGWREGGRTQASGRVSINARIDDNAALMIEATYILLDVVDNLNKSTTVLLVVTVILLILTVVGLFV